MTAPRLQGLVLSGGRSRRMNQDKAALVYGGRTQLARAVEVLAPHVGQVFVSVRADQVKDPTRAPYQQIQDIEGLEGPMAGILAALRSDPASAWLVLACDLPQLDHATLRALLAARDPGRVATAFRSAHDGLPEPLCAIYEPASAQALQEFAATGRNCPRKFLINADTVLLDQPNPEALDNVNTPEDLSVARRRVEGGAATRALHVQYFALLREQAGRGDEAVHSSAITARELYAELAARHSFTLPAEVLKVAINAEFADWSQTLTEGDAVVFIPPVAGG